MKTNMLAAGMAASLLALPAATHAQNEGDCMRMIPSPIINTLEQEGFGMVKICSLSLGQLVLINSLLSEDGMNSRARIQNILDNPG